MPTGKILTLPLVLAKGWYTMPSYLVPCSSKGLVHHGRVPESGNELTGSLGAEGLQPSKEHCPCPPQSRVQQRARLLRSKKEGRAGQGKFEAKCIQ